MNYPVLNQHNILGKIYYFIIVKYDKNTAAVLRMFVHILHFIIVTAHHNKL